MAGDTGDAGLIPGSGRSLGGGSGKTARCPLALLGESQGQRSLAGSRGPWIRESDTTEHDFWLSDKEDSVFFQENTLIIVNTLLQHER